MIYLVNTRWLTVEALPYNNKLYIENYNFLMYNIILQILDFKINYRV